jgi:hypothetical protein
MAYPTMNISTAATLPNIAFNNEIRTLLNDPTPGLVVSDTQLLNFINRSANIMTKEGKCQEVETTSVALSTGLTEYSYLTCGLSTAGNAIDYVVDIEAIIYTASIVANVDIPGVTAKTLVKISQNKLNHLDQNTSGPPLYWCDTGKSIRIWPVPTASEGGAGSQHMLTILHYKNTNTLKNDSDTGTTYYVPNHMREYAIWYALSEAYKRKGRYDVAQWFRALFDKFVIFHRDDRLRKPVDSMEDMTVADYTQYTQ